MNEVSGMNEAERTFYVCCISAEMWVIPTFFKIHQLPLQFWPFFSEEQHRSLPFFLKISEKLLHLVSADS